MNRGFCSSLLGWLSLLFGKDIPILFMGKLLWHKLMDGDLVLLLLKQIWILELNK